MCVKAIAGTRLTVIGKEKVPEDEAVLYISNHRSIFDIVLLFPLLNNPTAILAKKSIEKVPVISRWMKVVRCQFLDRNDIKQGLQCILNCIRFAKEGESVLIFPEGTRSKTRDMGEFKDGSFKVAQKSGCRIVPVAVTNTDQIFEAHLPWLAAQNVTIEFAEPIDMKELPAEEKKHIGEYVHKLVEDMYIRNRDAVN